MDYSAQPKEEPKYSDVKRVQCYECKGVGLKLKEDIIRCKTCHNMMMCNYCNISKKGENTYPYEECEKCFGNGEL